MVPHRIGAEFARHSTVPFISGRAALMHLQRAESSMQQGRDARHYSTERRSRADAELARVRQAYSMTVQQQQQVLILLLLGSERSLYMYDPPSLDPRIQQRAPKWEGETKREREGRRYRHTQSNSVGFLETADCADNDQTEGT